MASRALNNVSQLDAGFWGSNFFCNVYVVNDRIIFSKKLQPNFVF